jgi:putative hemolysin
MDLFLWFELLLFILLMGLSGFFSSSETALFSLNEIQLEQMRRDNHPKIERIMRLLAKPRRLIMTILIGNELVNVSASVISASLIIEMLGAEKKWINLFVMVPMLLLVGEITPKVMAVRHNIAFASFESGPIEVFARVISPLRWVIRKLADRIITLFVGENRSRGNIITEDMVRTLAHEAVGEGALDLLEAQYIDHIFDFGNKTIEDVMIPRSNIFFLSIDTPFSEMIAEMRQTRHTRVPIYREHRDNIIGILHVRDLLGKDFTKISEDSQGFINLLRTPSFVPESKMAADLFRNFRQRKISIALTVDEFGGVTGLVTMEDLLECIFGEIHSASEIPRRVSIEDLGGGRCAVDGSMPVLEFNQKMGTQLSDQWGETIGGLILHHYGELPSKGATIELNGLRFTVMDVEENRIRTVEFMRVGTPGKSESESAESSQTEMLDGKTDAKTTKTKGSPPADAPGALEEK